jgi:hypothetical protein
MDATLYLCFLYVATTSRTLTLFRRDCSTRCLLSLLSLTHTFTHTHLHTYTHSHIHTFTHSHIHTFTHSHIHTFTQSHIHTFTHSHIHTFTHSHIHTFTHSHIHTFTHSHIHTFTHSHIHTFTHSHIHTYTHSHIHTYTHTTYEVGITPAVPTLAIGATPSPRRCPRKSTSFCKQTGVPMCCARKPRPGQSWCIFLLILCPYLCFLFQVHRD